MADETTNEPKPQPAKAAKGGNPVLVKLASAGADDKFVIGEGDQTLEVTPQGVEVDESRVEDLLEIAAYNGVPVVVTPVDEGK